MHLFVGASSETVWWIESEHGRERREDDWHGDKVEDHYDIEKGYINKVKKKIRERE